MIPLSGGPISGEQAGFSICVFPHLTEFLVVDARPNKQDGPDLYVLTTDQVLDELFYSNIEDEFHSLLRQPDQPLSYLINVPQQLEAILRHRALSSIVSAVSGESSTNLPEQVAVLICAGEILNVPAKQVAEIFDQLTGKEASGEIVKEWVYEFERLQQLERLRVRDEMEDQRLEAVTQKDGEFYTLWENPSQKK